MIFNKTYFSVFSTKFFFSLWVFVFYFYLISIFFQTSASALFLFAIRPMRISDTTLATICWNFCHELQERLIPAFMCLFKRLPPIFLTFVIPIPQWHIAGLENSEWAILTIRWYAWTLNSFKLWETNSLSWISKMIPYPYWRVKRVNNIVQIPKACKESNSSH